MVKIVLKCYLIYAQSGYLYTIFLDLPQPSDANAPGEYHVANIIVGSISHHYQQPYYLTHMSYGKAEGGTSTSHSYLRAPGNPYLGQSMPYTFPQSHQQIPGKFISQPVNSNVSPPPYVPYAPSSPPSPLVLAPQPTMPPHAL